MNSLNITSQTPLSRTCEGYEVIFSLIYNSYIFRLKGVAIFLSLCNKHSYYLLFYVSLLYASNIH